VGQVGQVGQASRVSQVGWIVAAIAALTLFVSAQAPDPGPQLKIVSPGEESYVSGPTLLRATMVPADAVASVTFFVDGRQVCALTRPPFECDWDAGPAIGEHQVRAGRCVGRGRPRGADRSHQGRHGHRKGQRRRRAGDGDGHRRRGRFVRNLPRSAFHVSEDGKGQGITHFTSEDVPLEIVVAIDISGSMTPAMPKLKKAVKEFLADVPKQDLVTLLGFNDTIFTLTRKTRRSGGARQGRRSAGAVGVHGALRRGFCVGVEDAWPADGTQKR